MVNFDKKRSWTLCDLLSVTAFKATAQRVRLFKTPLHAGGKEPANLLTSRVERFSRVESVQFVRQTKSLMEGRVRERNVSASTFSKKDNLNSNTFVRFSHAFRKTAQKHSSQSLSDSTIQDRTLDLTNILYPR